MADPDAELVRRTLKGDPEAYGVLVLRHSDFVHGLVYGILLHREDALETTQAVFLRGYERLSHLRDADRFRSWLGRIATSQAKNRLRSRRDVIADTPAEIISNTAEPLEILVEAENRRRLRRALDRIPEKNRLPLVLRYQSRMGYQEIAEALDIPATTVRSRMYEGKKMLRDELKSRLKETR